MNYNEDFFPGCGEQKCMFPHCKKITKNGARGLCNNHYVGWRRRVKEEQKFKTGDTSIVVTWGELEKRGMCKKKLSQSEKNMKQMHPHKSYNRKKPKYDF